MLHSLQLIHFTGQKAFYFLNLNLVFFDPQNSIPFKENLSKISKIVSLSCLFLDGCTRKLPQPKSSVYNRNTGKVAPERMLRGNWICLAGRGSNKHWFYDRSGGGGEHPFSHVHSLSRPKSGVEFEKCKHFLFVEVIYWNFEKHWILKLLKERDFSHRRGIITH